MHRLKMDELKWKVMKIWNNSEGGEKDKTDENGSPNVENGNGKLKGDKALSVSDFENEFARRYKASLDPKLYGFNFMYQLLQSMSDVLDMPPPPQLQSDGDTPFFSQLPAGTRSSKCSDSSPSGASANVNVNANTNTNTNTNASANVNVNANTNANANANANINANANTRTNSMNAIERKGYPRNLGTSTDVSNVKIAPINTNSMNSLMQRKDPIGANGSATVHMFSNGFMPTTPKYASVQLNNNTKFPIAMPPLPMYSGIIPQTSDMEAPWSTLESVWPFQSIPTQQSQQHQPQQQQVLLPSFSNLGTFSNRSLENFSTGMNKPPTNPTFDTLILYCIYNTYMYTYIIKTIVYVLPMFVYVRVYACIIQPPVKWKPIWNTRKALWLIFKQEYEFTLLHCSTALTCNTFPPRAIWSVACFAMLLFLFVCFVVCFSFLVFKLLDIDPQQVVQSKGIFCFYSFLFIIRDGSEGNRGVKKHLRDVMILVVASVEFFIQNYFYFIFRFLFVCLNWRVSLALIHVVITLATFNFGESISQCSLLYLLYFRSVFKKNVSAKKNQMT
ncbi:hypothetical protein RFI_24596 [Reticulomyxa filosa]|uniref:HTH OST-type domain-containing protein n=1 Tax=Reticulomyxa filosa TaxID=46433 RepID=X6MI94_RETFI|nr:hypothetical protein RFI_24596 [Reticulomyxa filosa]|eukprot:ETO12780.1 hypothetical protein RFI_24596 [Reticulomyxa filosa]